MCGIAGYIGHRDAFPILQKSLKKLNYRGYDSWGIGFKNHKGIEVIKDVGDFEKLEELPAVESTCGISHTRWATTGRVIKENAHPHTEESGNIIVVHNGIIENFQELKEELINKGHKFKSDTDTEVVCHLIEEYSDNEFADSVRKAFLRLMGRNAIVALHKNFEGLVGVKNGSPLVVGIKNASDKEEYFIASDPRAFIHETNEVIFLDDNEMVILN